LLKLTLSLTDLSLFVTFRANRIFSQNEPASLDSPDVHITYSFVGEILGHHEEHLQLPSLQSFQCHFLLDPLAFSSPHSSPACSCIPPTTPDEMSPPNIAQEMKKDFLSCFLSLRDTQAAVFVLDSKSEQP
jgi:hypothetical protein